MNTMGNDPDFSELRKFAAGVIRGLGVAKGAELEDLTSSVIRKALNSEQVRTHKITDEKALKAYLRKIIQNELPRHFERQSKKMKELNSSDLPATPHSVGRVVRTREELLAARESVSQNFSKKHSKYWQMHHFDGLSIRDIAAVEKVLEATVRQALKRIRTFLQEKDGNSKS